MSVSIVKASLDNVPGRLKVLLEQINYRPVKDRIFLKPNLVAAVPPDRGVITHPKVTAAIIEYFQDLGCEVVIGESSSVAQNTRKVFEMTGYCALAQRYGVELLDLNESTRVRHKWKYGELAIPEIIFTHEYVNIAKMKTHIGAQVTLGIKNQKGLLSNAEKKRFHVQYFLNDAVAELGSVLCPDLTVIDGIIALEGDGPGGAGTPVPDMEVLVAGKDVVEVDTIASRIMGFEPGEIKHIPVRDHVDVVGVPLEQVQRRFKRAKDNHLTIQQMRFFSMRGCSGCTERFTMGYRMLGPERFRELKIDVVAGVSPQVQCPHRPIVCFGDCTRAFAQEHQLPYVKGCPPDPALMASILEAHTTEA